MEIIPRPRQLELQAGESFIRSLLTFAGPSPAEGAISLLVAWATKRDGLDVARQEGGGADVVLVEQSSALGGDESYDLIVSPSGIRIHATTAVGFQYAVQTLIVLAVGDAGASWPAVTIKDSPHFEWRGLLLDCCRSFISKQGILRLLDQMAACKLNRLHWHLTDDQGWRLEVERYPKLTEEGAWRDRESVREGGYYSKTDVREIVAYAATRGIEIMPEIELPGHATAAIAAYPELGCGDVPVKVGTEWGIYPHNYNAGSEQVFEFLETVLSEVCELFPFRYIHLGADECMKDEWKKNPDCQRRITEEGLGDEYGLQTYFVNRVAAMLRKQGRVAVGWDEILEGEVSADMVVQCWRDESVIAPALARGHRVIATPRKYCYFDLAVSQVDLADVYAFDPTCGLPEVHGGASVIGGEATLWTEYISEEEMDHMLFPRLLAMAEALWLGPAAKDSFSLFEQRARSVTARMQAAGVTAGPALRTDQPAATMKGRTDLDTQPEGLDKLGLG